MKNDFKSKSKSNGLPFASIGLQLIIAIKIAITENG